MKNLLSIEQFIIVLESIEGEADAVRMQTEEWLEHERRIKEKERLERELSEQPEIEDLSQ
jgi:hypothetical protein